MVQLIEAGEQLQTYLDRAVAESISKLSFIREPEPEIISGSELQKRLDISEPTLIRWRQKGKIPYLQLGASIRYNWHEVIKALEVPTKKRGGNR